MSSPTARPRTEPHAASRMDARRHAGDARLLASHALVDARVVLVLGPDAPRVIREVRAESPASAIVVADVRRVPFAPGSFDAILFTDVLESCDEPRRTLLSLRRLLSPRGVLAGVISAPELGRRLEDVLSGLWGAARDSIDGIRRYHRREIGLLFTETGLEPVILRAVPRDGVASGPLPVDGATADVRVGAHVVVADRSASDVDDLTARAFLVVARAAPGRRPLCSIVVVVHDDTDGARACIEEIRTHPPRVDYELVVVDDASGDERIASLADRVLRNRTRRGFGASCNRAAAAATGEFLAFLHADTWPHEGWLDEMVAAARESPVVGAVGPKLVSADGTLAGAGMVVRSDGVPYDLYAHHPADAPHANRLRRVAAVSGACMLVRAEAFAQAGGFDEALVDGYEDADLCFAIRARGFSIQYCPTATATHGLREPPEARAHRLGNLNRLVTKWAGAVAPDDLAVYREDGSDVVANRGRSWSLPPVARARADGRAAICWTNRFQPLDGYSVEARNTVFGLDLVGVDVLANTADAWPRADLSPDEAARFDRMLTAPLAPPFVNVVHATPDYFKRDPRAVLNVGRTMFETEGLPERYLASCKVMDEIWVPSRFNRRTFAEAGVSADDVHVVPCGVDVEAFHPAAGPLDLGLEGFVFLAVFQWDLRKGWDVLVRGYLEEFEPDEPVTLALKIGPRSERPEEYRSKIERYVRESLGRDLRKGPSIVILDLTLPLRSMPSLYRAAHAFVSPSRGEGWNQPAMEAMSCGVPTIASRCSGHEDFMSDETCYLVGGTRRKAEPPADEIFAGRYWFEPDRRQLRRMMRRAFERPEEATAKGAAARAHIASAFTLRQAARAVLSRLEAAGIDVAYRARGPHGS